MYVTASELNVRSKPTVHSEVVCTIHQNDEVTVQTEGVDADEYRWVMVTRAGFDIGFVAEEFLSEENTRPAPVNVEVVQEHHDALRQHGSDFRKLWGIHSINIHGEPWHFEIARRVQPTVIKIVDPDVQTLSDFYKASPNSLFVLRSYATSDGGGGHKSYLITEASDPHSLAASDARDMRAIWDNFERQASEREGISIPPIERVLFTNCNEPGDDRNLAAVVNYNAACCKTFADLGMRLGAVNLSVGHPVNTSPGTHPYTGEDHTVDWSGWEPLWKAMDGTNHVLILHEYSPANHESPENSFITGAGWYMLRYTTLKDYTGPILFGECGVERYTTEPTVDGNERGWRSFMNEEQYISNVKWLVEQWGKDPRIIGGVHYLNDGAKPWYVSFSATPKMADLWIDWGS